jgi:hypothetical protein
MQLFLSLCHLCFPCLLNFEPFSESLIVSD